MKIDYCDHCHHPVFFENTKCLNCGRALAFFPDGREVLTLEDAGDGLWRRTQSSDKFRLCDNYREHDVCNWVIAAEDPHTLCVSCRLTRVIPDLSQPGALASWHKLMVAQRRLVYSLLALKLPLKNKVEDPAAGLAFEFLADPLPDAEGNVVPVLTGHDNGVIVINIAEADDVERESRKKAMGEPYRTLLGHFRHEIGHYYWDRLIAGTPRLEPFRALFGDESADYAEALAKHYANGPPADWNLRFISSYATCHPWEDWAETWAHYLHMIDSVETARTSAIAFRPHKTAITGANEFGKDNADSFAAMIRDWFTLTCVLNNLNRGLGLPDCYPFVLTDPVIAKLKFIHEAIASPGVGQK